MYQCIVCIDQVQGESFPTWGNFPKIPRRKMLSEAEVCFCCPGAGWNFKNHRKLLGKCWDFIYILWDSPSGVIKHG